MGSTRDWEIIPREQLRRVRSTDGIRRWAVATQHALYLLKPDGTEYAELANHPLAAPPEARIQNMKLGGSEIAAPTNRPGEYHPRIYRPTPSLNPILGFETEASTSVRIATMRLRMLDRVFEVVEPCPSNLGCFGLEIRQVLLLACMEVESGLRAVLRANGGLQRPSGEGERRSNMNDYVKLKAPLVADGWIVRFLSYPELPSVAPFEGWGSGASTTPAWYEDQHRTKHNREISLDAATLRSSLNAVAAVLVLHVSQFGPETLESNPAFRGLEFSAPNWPLESDYPPPALGKCRRGAFDKSDTAGHDQRWSPVPHPSVCA